MSCHLDDVSPLEPHTLGTSARSTPRLVSISTTLPNRPSKTAETTVAVPSNLDAGSGWGRPDTWAATSQTAIAAAIHGQETRGGTAGCGSGDSDEITDRRQLCLPDSRHLEEILDLAERAIGIPMGHDPLGQHRPHARQILEFGR